MSNIEELKKIIADAPEGASHVLFQSLDNIYIKFDTHNKSYMYCSHKDGWRLSTQAFYSKLNRTSALQSLRGIEQYVTLRNSL